VNRPFLSSFAEKVHRHPDPDENPRTEIELLYKYINIYIFINNSDSELPGPTTETDSTARLFPRASRMGDLAAGGSTSPISGRDSGMIQPGAVLAPIEHEALENAGSQG
jgi:hypothetical protein